MCFVCEIYSGTFCVWNCFDLDAVREAKPALTVSVEVAHVLSTGGLVLGVKVTHGLQTTLARLLHQSALWREVVVRGTSARETQHANIGHNRHVIRYEEELQRRHCHLLV